MEGNISNTPIDAKIGTTKILLKPSGSILAPELCEFIFNIFFIQLVYSTTCSYFALCFLIVKLPH